MFDATTAKFRDITFQKVNFDENKDLVGKYNVSSIPRLIMLDSSDRPIYNDSPPASLEGMSALISQHR